MFVISLKMMLVRFMGLRIAILSLVLGGLLGCSELVNLSFISSAINRRNITEISQLKQEENLNSTVYLQGTVGKRVRFVDSGAYQLQDDTDSIWVFTDRSLPNRGDRLAIKGKVEYKSIPIEEQELGELYIVEIEQLEGQANSRTNPID